MIFYEGRVRRMELFSYSLHSSVHSINDRGKNLHVSKSTCGLQVGDPGPERRKIISGTDRKT